MRPFLAPVFAGAVAGVAAVLAGTASAVPAGDGEAEAATLFQDRCATCHTVPDPALRTDRAWLDQVNRTA